MQSQSRLVIASSAALSDRRAARRVKARLLSPTGPPCSERLGPGKLSVFLSFDYFPYLQKEHRHKNKVYTASPNSMRTLEEI